MLHTNPIVNPQAAVKLTLTKESALQLPPLLLPLGKGS